MGLVDDNLRGGATECSAHKGSSVATTQLAAYINQRPTGRAIIFGGDTNLHTDVPAKRPEWAWGTRCGPTS